MIKPALKPHEKTAELDESIQSNLVKLLFDGQPRSLSLIAINSIVMVIAQWPVIDQRILIVWVTCVLALCLWRWWNYHAYSTQGETPGKDMRYWKAKAEQGAILSGFLWGITAFLLMPAENIGHQALIIAVLVGMSAGSVVTLAAVPVALKGYLILVLVPLIIRLFMLGSVPNFALGFMSILYFYYLYSGAQYNYAALVENMQIRRSREKAKEIIEHQAYHDDLTDLPNRRLLLDRLNVAIAHATRHGHIGAVLFLDLDRFKIINDSLGHRIGDCLLVELSQRLVSNLRHEDTAARLGGDEFILLLSELGGDIETATTNAKTIAEHLQEILAEPFEIEGHHLHISFSIGIALFPTNGDDASDLLKHADSAMYQAKAAGRNTIRFFMTSMQEAVQRKLYLEEGLRNALDGPEVSLDYQVLKSFNGDIAGVEGLLRWKHPDIGQIIPENFIPIAEDSSLIRDLGQFVLRSACRNLKQLEEYYGDTTSPFFISINISPKEFSYKNFSEEFLAIVKESQIDPTRLHLELTESTLLMDIADAKIKMEQLREVGIKLAIDDFGTGHSSLAYLKHLPVDIIKIDRALINDIGSEPVDAIIVETTIQMAKKLGLSVVAEGVEDEDTLNWLKGFGCDLAQGFYLGRPLTFEQLLDELPPSNKSDDSAVGVNA